MSHNIGCDRRRFLGAALAAFGVPELVVNEPTSAHTRWDTNDHQRHGEAVVGGFASLGMRRRAPTVAHA